MVETLYEPRKERRIMNFWNKIATIQEGLRRFCTKRACDSEKAEEIFVYACDQCLRLYQDRDCLELKKLLFTVAKRRLIELSKRSRRLHRELPSLALDNMADLSSPPSRSIEIRELAIRVNAGLDQLPTRCRIIIRRRFFANQPLEQIAAELGVPVGTVKSRFARGKQRLQLILGEFWQNNN